MSKVGSHREPFIGIVSGIGQHYMAIFCILMFLLRIQDMKFFDILHLPASGLYLHGINIIKILMTCVMGIIISKTIFNINKIKNKQRIYLII